MNFGLCHIHLTEPSINLEDAAPPGASETACSALARARSAADARVSQADEHRGERDSGPAVARPGASAAGYLENGYGVVGWPISPGLYAGRIGDLRADRSVLPGLLEDDLFRVPFELRTICESERLQTITIAQL